MTKFALILALALGTLATGCTGADEDTAADSAE